MSGSELARFSAACPDCGHLNQIIADHAPQSTRVTCSECRTVLGYLGELTARDERLNGPAEALNGKRRPV